MTTQDIYAWVQMGLQIVIGGGIVVGFSRYFGILRRAIEGQKATIEAQAEQMKAQSMVLQDSERLNKVMQQVIDFVDPEAQLKRERAYRERLDRDIKTLEDDMAAMRQEWRNAQTMAHELLLLSRKALNGLERSTTSLRKALLESQKDVLVIEAAHLMMREGDMEQEKYIKLLQKLKNQTQEEEHREQTCFSPGHELIDGAKADCTSDEQP